MRWVIENNANDVGYVTKGTTRAQRPYELKDPEFQLDLEFLTRSEFAAKKYTYTYNYGGELYGFSRESLTEALLESENVFVIVRSTSTIDRIAEEYSFINVVPVFTYTDEARLVKRLENEGFSADVIAQRLERSKVAFSEYYNHPHCYREVLINNSSLETFHNTIYRVLVEKYNKVASINPYLIAVMMSYNPDNKRLDDYYDALTYAVRDISPKFECKRIDNALGSPKIDDEFVGLVGNARCFIVDLTESKQNVYYELGYARAKGKTVLITAEAGTQTSFYALQHKIIYYHSAHDLRRTVSAQLSGMLRIIPGM
jgi:guanylate kinase